jgi:hypothetical protein
MVNTQAIAKMET